MSLGIIHPGSMRNRPRHKSPSTIRKQRERKEGRIFLADKSLAKMTVKELRELCVERNLKINSKFKKTELISALRVKNG